MCHHCLIGSYLRARSGKGIQRPQGVTHASREKPEEFQVFSAWSWSRQQQWLQTAIGTGILSGLDGTGLELTGLDWNAWSYVLILSSMVKTSSD